jgi:hypothetical protein
MSGWPYQDGAPQPGLYPFTPTDVLNSVAAASGVAVPTDLAFTPIVLSPANTTVPLLSANANRSYLLIYNPAFVPAQFSLGTAAQGAITNLAIGPGEAFFQAAAQGLAPTYGGALTAIGTFDQLSLWTWEDGANLYNDGGALAVVSPPAGYPISPVGLPPGALWIDPGTGNGVIGIIPGITPDPTAPPVYFGQITAGNLLALGGGNLPLTNPAPGTLQLWNDGGMLAIA